MIKASLQNTAEGRVPACTEIDHVERRSIVKAERLDDGECRCRHRRSMEAIYTRARLGLGVATTWAWRLNRPGLNTVIAGLRVHWQVAHDEFQVNLQQASFSFAGLSPRVSGLRLTT